MLEATWVRINRSYCFTQLTIYLKQYCTRMRVSYMTKTWQLCNEVIYLPNNNVELNTIVRLFKREDTNLGLFV